MSYNEQMLVARILFNPAILAEATVTPEHYYNSLYKRMHQAIERAVADGVEPDILLIRQYDKHLPPEELAKISEHAFTDTNWQYYEREIINDWRKRKLNELGGWIRENSGAPVEATDYIQSELSRILATSKGDVIHYRPDLLRAAVDEMEARYKSAGEIPGISTGYSTLDKYIHGYKPRLLYYIGGRPSTGKSAILLNLADNASIRAHKAVGFISIESSKEELMHRSFSAEANMASSKIDLGALQPADFKTLTDTAGHIDKAQLWIYDSPNQTIARIASVARQMVRHKGCEILFVDYLQLIKASGESKREQVAEASNTLKQLARELDIPIVCAAQLVRDADNSRPNIGSFQHASQIEQDADVAMLLHPDRESESEHHVNVELIIAKCRDGKTGVVPLQFRKDVVRFNEIAE